MAIDSAVKRASALGVSNVTTTLVIPDGTLASNDRQTIAHCYSGISAGPPIIIEDFDVTPTQAMVDALVGMGFSGGAADLQQQWFDSLGIGPGSLDDRWNLYMDSVGVPDGDRSFRQTFLYQDFLGIPQGTSGLSINELKRAFWLAQ